MPANFRDPVMHILRAADLEFRDEIEEFNYQAPKIADELGSRAENSSADTETIKAAAAQIVSLRKDAERIAGYGDIDILGRLERMRSDLDYLYRLVVIFKEREANWKPRPPTGLAALGADYPDEVDIHDVKSRSSDDDEQTYDPWARIFGTKSDPSKAVRRQIVGDWLPEIFNHHFAPREFKVGGWDHDKGDREGPGIRFLIAATREIGIVQEDGSLWSASTLAGHCQAAIDRKKQIRSFGATKLH